MQASTYLKGLVICAALAVGLPAIAQDAGQVVSPILTIDSERVFGNTVSGQKISAEMEQRFNELGAENRRIEGELEAEELALTQQRATLAADEFRTLADAFDVKVQAIRAEQDAKQRALQQQQDAEQQGFLDRIAPILSAIGNRYGAVVILERRNVLLSADGVDITDEAIVRINEAFGASEGEDGQQSGNDSSQ